MGQDNTVPRRINRVEGEEGESMVFRGPGVLETFGAPGAPLVDFLRYRGHIHYIQFDDLNWSDTAGTTVINRVTQDMNIIIGNTETEVGRTAGIVRCFRVGGPSGEINWQKEVFFQFSLGRFGDGTHAIGFVQLKDVDVEGELADVGIGIKVTDLTLVGNCYGGGNHSGDLALATMILTEVIVVGIHFKPSEFVKFYINGVLQAAEETDVPDLTKNARLIISWKTVDAAHAETILSVYNPILIGAF